MNLECPRCRSTRFIPLKPVFAFQRSIWTLFRWTKVRVADVVGCDKCKRIWEVSDHGVAMVEDAPSIHEPPVVRTALEDDDDMRVPTHALADAVRRPEL
jgi:hypothetical protein